MELGRERGADQASLQVTTPVRGQGLGVEPISLQVTIPVQGQRREDGKKGEAITNTEQKAEEIYRVTVTKNTDEALTRIVDRVNDGFDGGKINRAQAVSWIVIHFAKCITEAIIQEMRVDHFDEMAVFESMFRKAKKTGKISNELRNLLQRQVGLDGVQVKKNKEKLQVA
jgi:hypothetical protein